MQQNVFDRSKYFLISNKNRKSNRKCKKITVGVSPKLSNCQNH